MLSRRQRPGRGRRAADGFRKVHVVDVEAGKIDVEPCAGDRRAAESGEQIHDQADPIAAVQSDALSGSLAGNVAGCGRSLSRS